MIRQLRAARSGFFLSLFLVCALLPSCAGNRAWGLTRAELIEAVPDYVGLSDAADVVGVSRQNLRQLMSRHASFPAPIHLGSTALWHLEDLMTWLQQTQHYTLEPCKYEVARMARQINLVRQTRALTPQLAESLKSLMA